MTSRFSFYDFLGYIIPGAILLLALTYWAESVVKFDLVTVGSVSDVGQTTLFLIVAYLVGHLMQAFGREFEKREARNWGGYFSVQFLRPDATFYTEDFKSQLLDAIRGTFGLTPLVDAPDSEMRDRRLQEMFNVCYTYVIQRGIGQHAEIHNATYGFFRGALVLWLVVIPLFFIAVLRHAAIAVASGLDYNQTPFDEVKWHLVVSGTAVLLAGATYPFLRERFKHFGWRFVDAVYRSFLVSVSSGGLTRQS
jgi:hypothetical protein